MTYFIYTMSFLSIPQLSFITFPPNIKLFVQLFSWLLYSILNFFSKIVSTVLSPLISLITCDQETVFLSLSIIKTYMISTRSNMISNFKFRNSIIIFYTSNNICYWLYMSRLYSIVLWYVLLYSSTILTILSIAYFLILKSYICNKTFSSNRFSFIMCWMDFYITILTAYFINLL